MATAFKAKVDRVLEAIRLNTESSSGLLVDIVRITPDFASALLESSPGNRSLRAKKINQLSDDISEGRWRMNGESIIVASDSSLLDGHHRCAAVVKAGKPIVSVVVWGIDRESSFPTIDTGVVRTTGDHLGLKGLKNYNNVAAVLAWIWRFENGIEPRTHVLSPSSMEAFELLQHHPEIPESVSLVGKFTGWNKTQVALLHYLTRNSPRADVNVFLEKLQSGVGLLEGDPILALRRFREAASSRKTVLPSHEWLAILFKAWNLWSTGMTVRFLRWRSSGDSPESFPKLKTD